MMINRQTMKGRKIRQKPTSAESEHEWVETTTEIEDSGGEISKLLLTKISLP